MTTHPDPPLPALAGRYAVGRELGHGGMATVYLARDLQNESTVAVKVLRPDVVPLLGVERFAREIRITARLQHPNILPVLDSGETDGVPFYVVPYIEGESLAQRLQREGQLPIPDALDVACDIATALEVAHAQGFVHRDIKPSNILLANGRAILADFGIARAVDVLTGEKLTESGVVLGTPAYMSPEQSSGGRLDGRADIYSLGCVLFEMLTGSPPFTGPTTQAVRARHDLDSVPSIRIVRDTVSPSLERVVVKALAKVPADRFANAHQLVGALRQIDQTEHITLRRPRFHRRQAIRAVLAVAVVGAAVAAWRVARGGSNELDRNRIMVYPLVVPGESRGSRTVGEDVATMIGSALDGAGPLRWIDGWPLLDPARREDIRTLPLSMARSLARSKRCGYYLTGRLVGRGDSADVFLELHDVAGDSTLARGKATGLMVDAWHQGLRAVNEVLPKLIPVGAPDIVAEWRDRSPTAIASFLLGEAAFRRLRLTEALDHYRDAVKSDSLFSLAAIRGAQAASWSHRSSEAASLIAVAVRQPLAPRYAHFARGYQAWLDGRADSAAAEFRRALVLDPEMSVAWMQLGEVYTHLLPAAGNVDSLAEAAFEEAHRLDPHATNLLLHLIEIRFRGGDTARARPLVQEFLAAEPDTELAAQVKLMDACMRRGPDRLDWQREARAHPRPILWAANALKGAGAQIPCAVRAYAAVLGSDTAKDAWGEARRWAALMGLQGIRLAQGRAAEARAPIDSAIAHGGVGTSLYLLDAPLFPEFRARAREIARQDQTKFGQDYLKCPFPTRLWELGLWEAHEGRLTVISAMARGLEARAAKSGAPGDWLMARAMAAQDALARADTAQALARFSALMGEGVPLTELNWSEVSPRGSERLTLVRLLINRGQFQRAIDVANVFDSSWPLVYIIYLPTSLKLRAEAAMALGDTEQAARYRSRLAALSGERVVAER